MTRFRPCIDLHAGQVKQIVGGTLSTQTSDLKTNYVSGLHPSHFAELYKNSGLHGAHVILLGPGNAEAAQSALDAWPNGLQVGGGITDSNALEWIQRGAEKVIITSYLFPEAKFSLERLQAVLSALGNNKSRLVIDLSCRRQGHGWVVAMNKWQTLTDMEINEESIKMLEPYCSEFLIHAADKEGLQSGIDETLVGRLGLWCSVPVTYAGGARTLDDFETVKALSGGKVDLTIGSALDIFGGQGVNDGAAVEKDIEVLGPSTQPIRGRIQPLAGGSPSPRTVHHDISTSSTTSLDRRPHPYQPLPLKSYYNMKPLVSAFNAWSCVVVSVFAIVILSIIGGLFKAEHHSMVGSKEDPADGKAVAGSVFAAVIVYAVFLVFCGLQGVLHMRQSNRGAISLN